MLSSTKDQSFRIDLEIGGVVPVEHNKTHLEPGDEPPPDDQFIPIPEAHYAAMG
jgi:hypothetical protein